VEYVTWYWANIVGSARSLRILAILRGRTPNPCCLRCAVR
jgi:hypothetical protein